MCVFRVSLAKHNFESAEGTNTVGLIHKFCNKICCSTKKKIWTWKCLLRDSLVQFGRRQRLDMEIVWPAFISYVNMNTSKFSTSPTPNTYLAMLKNCAESGLSYIFCKSARWQTILHYIFLHGILCLGISLGVPCVFVSVQAPS